MNHAEPLLDSMEEFPLTQNCPACGTSIDLSAEYPLARFACPACGAEDLVDGHFDHFDLQEIVGRGGMGVVYKARDESLDRFVALKLLRLDKTTDAAVVQQMATEAAITASINHPHVVRVFTTGTDRGRFFIAMELVDKGTLDQLIQLQGRVAEAQVLQVGIQIAQGLRAAQAAGLIHRDVKPGNILFADAHTAKIVDFGLAIFMEDEEKARGEIWGTPYYVAPEKLENQREDFRSDIYSLGGTLFHALAGRPPFEAENASMVALKHLKSQAVSLHTFAPHVSSQTVYVINRTLAKNPNDRYQSYDELIEHFEFALAQLQENAAKPRLQTRVVMEDEQSQQMIGRIMLAVVVLLVLGGIGAFIFRKELFGEGRTTPKSIAAIATAPAVARTGPLFPDALAALGGGDAADALELYRKHLADPKLTAYQLAWANMGEATAALAAGKLAEARAAFRAISDRAPLESGPADEKAAEFLVDTARRLASDRPVEPAEAKKLDGTSHEALGVLLFALKDFNTGRFPESAALFRQFRQTAPAGSYAWIGGLKPLATQFIEDLTAFDMGAGQLKAATTPAQRQDALVVLRKIKGPLAPRVEELEQSLPPLPLVVAAPATPAPTPPTPAMQAGTVILPTSAAQPQQWRYTTKNPGPNWMQPEFSDAAWETGPAPFGTGVGAPNTKWATNDIWLRREITLPAALPAALEFQILCDDEAEIFINSVPAGSQKDYTKTYVPLAMTPQARAVLQPGKNVIAVHCRQGRGEQGIDVGINAASKP